MTNGKVNGKEDKSVSGSSSGSSSGIDLSGLKSLVLPAGIVVLGYYVLKSQGIISPTYPPSTNITPACPRGTAYMTEIWKDCDPGYLGERSSWIPFSPQKCVCIGTTGNLSNWKPLSQQEKNRLNIR